MENNIGVGIIVGLVITSSLYVWNSINFTQNQKTFLLLCFIFPPLQWIGIIAILAYNNFKAENNSTQSIKISSESKLKISKENLNELKEKGILTEEEHKEKVEKLELQNNEQQIINSIEYSQLKNLLESGILTKEEFDLKVDIVKRNYFKKENNVVEKPTEKLPEGTSATYKTKQGLLTLTGEYYTQDKKIIKAFLDGKKAPDGKYRLEFMWYVKVKDGIVI